MTMMFQYSPLFQVLVYEEFKQIVYILKHQVPLQTMHYDTLNLQIAKAKVLE